MPEPALLLAAIMVLALTLYALLGGADFGGGVWDLLASGKTARAQRETIARAIAPVWEANHVWLILVVTVLFNAFPRAFAWLSIYLHIPPFRRRALVSGALTGVLALGVFLLAGNAPHLRAGLTASPWALPLHLCTGAAAIAAFVMLWTRRFWWARVAAAAQVALIVWGWALAQYPYLVRPDITIASSAAPEPVLVLLLRVLFLGAVVLIPSLVYLFRIFAPRARE